jgi:hypothetical protein
MNAVIHADLVIVFVRPDDPVAEAQCDIIRQMYPDLCVWWFITPESYCWWAGAAQAALAQYASYGIPERRMLNA